MRKRITSLLLGVLLLLTMTVTAFAAEGQAGSFVFTAMNANSTIVEPTRVSYKAGQTIKEALADSDIAFVGLEQGFIYEINGVSANYLLYYDNGGYELGAQASSITALCFHVSSTYSDDAIKLITRMADYLDMTNHVQNYPAAANAYAAALKGLRTATAESATTLLDGLNNAIADYGKLMDGTKYTVSAAATQNGASVSAPVVTLTDAYGNVTTGTNSVQVIAGDYKFSVSDGGYNRTDGTLTVSADAQISVTLPYGQWFGNIRLLDYSKEPFRYTQDKTTHTAQYWIKDTAMPLGSIYLNAAMGDVPDADTTYLRTIYVGTNGKDMSSTARSWDSTATGLTYLVKQGMEGRTFTLEAQYKAADGYTQVQSYTVTVTRVPTLASLSVTAEGTKLPLAFEPTTTSYSLTTVSSTLDIAAAPFGEDYTVTGTGAASLEGDTLTHSIQVAAPNGEQNTYTLRVQKVASVPVTLTIPAGTTVQVLNGAGSEIAPVSGVYHLVPGETYTCIATKNTWYHTQITFTASSGLKVSVPEPDTTDGLKALALYSGTSASNRQPYKADKTFAAAAHSYSYTVTDFNSKAAIQATAADTDAVITALYRSQSTVPEIHDVETSVTITQPVNTAKKADNLSSLVAKAGYGQDLTIRVSKTVGDVTYYQDYEMRLVRQLHLAGLTAATKDEQLPFVTASGGTTKFDRDNTDYYVKVDRETTALYISGTYPNSSTDTSCCGGYYAKVNGVRYDTLESVEAALNTDLYNEDISVQVCHADTDSIELTYTVHVQKSDPIQLTIQTTPADATVFLTNDLNGKRIVEKNGTYSLTPGASYSYIVTCTGYIGQKVTGYIAPDKDGTLTITLEKAPANDTLINFDSAWPHLRQNNENNGVVDYKTPVYAKNAELYWATSIGSGYDVNACGCPILVNGAIYTYSGSRIYKVDAISGEILIDKPMDHNSSFAINPPTYANGMIFVGLSDGTIQAFDANTLDSLWIYRDSIGGQPNSSIVYHDGYIYTGFWVGEINEAHYVCLSATDEDPTQTMEEKLPTWYYTSKGGFYWAGAYVCDDFLLIGTDDGASGYTTGKPSLLSFDPKTGELLSSYKMNVTGDIRSSITHYNGKYYFTSKGGYFFEASVDAKGKIESVRTRQLYNYANDPTNPAMSTCTPTIYNGRAYIGISGTAQFGAYSGHNLTVIDIPNWEIAYTVRTHGYPQTSGVLTTAYMEETGCVYVYFFDNFTPGKLRVLEDKPGQTEVSLKTMETYTASGQTATYTTPYNIFTPSGAQAQYAICSPIMDEYGTIYFKNDSAYLMAVGSTIERIEITKQPDKTEYKEKETFDPTGMEVTAYYANGKTRDVTEYVTWSEQPLTANDTDFQITFPYAMYRNEENSDTLEMTYGVQCDKPMTAVTLTITGGEEVNYGDVNSDNTIDVSDAMLVCQIYLGNATPTDVQKLAADVNGDEVIDVSDAMMICQYYLGNITEFPAASAAPKS